MVTTKQAERIEAIKHLRKILRPGSRVYTILRHVSKSGMTRRIDLYAIKKNDRVYLTGYAARAMAMPISKNGGIVIGGCGMDMGFALVYDLGRALFPKGFRNKTRGRNGTPAGEIDTDGGYALKQEWL